MFEHPEGPVFRVGPDGETLEVVPNSAEYTDSLRHLRRTEPSGAGVLVFERFCIPVGWAYAH